MGIRQKMREQPRLGTALVALIALVLAIGGALVLKGSGGDRSAEVVAELEQEEVEKFEAEAESVSTTTEETVAPRQTTTTTTRRQSPTTVPASTVPNTEEPIADGGSEEDPETEEPVAEVTTTQAPATTEAPPPGPTRVIRELTTPVQVYDEPSLSASVEGELGISVPVEVKERKEGWYRIESEFASGWIFGAYVVPAPDPEFQAVISVDGSPLKLQYLDGDPVPDAYAPGKYGFGFVQPDGARSLVFMPDGLVVYVPTNSIRLVQ